MNFSQLLNRQCRPKVCIMLYDDRNNGTFECVAIGPVAASAALSGRQTRGPDIAQDSKQAKQLPTS
jgi:hypothetical protein